MEFKGIEITDILGFGRASEKLIDMIQVGCGAIYRPIGIEREAKAHANATLVLSDAHNQKIDALADVIRRNSDIPIASEGSKVTIDPSVAPIAERAKARLVHDAITDQTNIESVISLTARELKDATDVSDEPADERWARRYFGSVAEISDPEVQKIWAKVLAGEIKKKGSFSLRSLEVLRNLSTEEATLFQKLGEYTLNAGHYAFVFASITELDKYKMTYWDISKLENCGIMSIDLKLITVVEDKFSMSNIGFECNISKYKGKAKPHMLFKPHKIDITIYTLTSNGFELSKLVQQDLNIDYVKDAILHLNAQKNYPEITAMYHIKEDIEDYSNEKNLLE